MYSEQPEQKKSANESLPVSEVDSVCEIIPGLPNEMAVCISRFFREGDLNHIQAVSHGMSKLLPDLYRENYSTLTQGSLWTCLLSHPDNIYDALKAYASDIFKDDQDMLKLFKYQDMREFFEHFGNKIGNAAYKKEFQVLMNKACYDRLTNNDKRSEWLEHIQKLAAECHRKGGIIDPRSRFLPQEYVSRAVKFLKSANELERILTVLLLWKKMKKHYASSLTHKIKKIDFTPIVLNSQWNVMLTGKGLVLLDICTLNRLLKQLIQKHEALSFAVQSEESAESIVTSRIAIEKMLDKLTEVNLMQYAAFDYKNPRRILKSSYLLRDGKISNENLVKLSKKLDADDFKKVLDANPVFASRLNFELLTQILMVSTSHTAEIVLMHPQLEHFFKDKQIISLFKEINGSVILGRLLNNNVFLSRSTSSLLIDIACINYDYALQLVDSSTARAKFRSRDLQELKERYRWTTKKKQIIDSEISKKLEPSSSTYGPMENTQHRVEEGKSKQHQVSVGVRRTTDKVILDKSDKPVNQVRRMPCESKNKQQKNKKGNGILPSPVSDNSEAKKSDSSRSKQFGKMAGYVVLTAFILLTAIISMPLLIVGGLGYGAYYAAHRKPREKSVKPVLLKESTISTRGVQTKIEDDSHSPSCLETISPEAQEPSLSDTKREYGCFHNDQPSPSPATILGSSISKVISAPHNKKEAVQTDDVKNLTGDMINPRQCHAGIIHK